MIIIVRALSQWGKNDGDDDSPMSRDETLDKNKNGGGQMSPQSIKKQKNERKWEKGLCYYPLPHLCLIVAPCPSYRESPIFSLPYAIGNFSLFFVQSLIPTCGGIIVSIIISSPRQCPNYESITLLFTYNSILQLDKNYTRWLYMNGSGSVQGCAMI